MQLHLDSTGYLHHLSLTSCLARAALLCAAWRGFCPLPSKIKSACILQEADHRWPPRTMSTVQNGADKPSGINSKVTLVDFLWWLKTTLCSCWCANYIESKGGSQVTKFKVLVNREETGVDEWVEHSRQLLVSQWKTLKSVLVFTYETYRTTSSVCNDTSYI